MKQTRLPLLLLAAMGLSFMAPSQEQPKRVFPGQFKGGNAPAQPMTSAQTSSAPTDQPAPTRQASGAITGNLQFGGFTLQNASLTEVVDALARQLKLNYILPKSFAGAVTLNTYGDLKEIDPRRLLDLVLGINGYAMVKTGEVYQIVPTKELSHQPLTPETQNKGIQDDDAPMLNLVFLKYITADELANVLTKFIGEGGQVLTYPPANLMFLLDSHRNMKRLMELVSLFDDNALAKQRVHLYEVKNGRPSDLARELSAVLKSISLNDKEAPIRFVPVDRINTLIAVAPNPGAFDTIGEWVTKLDVPSEPTAGATDNYVYHVKFGNAQCLAAAIRELYSTVDPSAYGYGGIGMGLGLEFACNQNSAFGNFGGGFGNFSGSNMNGGFGGNGYGGGFGGGYGGYGAPGAFGGYGGYGAYGQYGGGYGYGTGIGAPSMSPMASASNGTTQSGTNGNGSSLGQTGNYLSSSATPYGPQTSLRIVPNPLDNTLLINATPAQYKSISKLLTQIDIPPRQVLIDAKIYEVDVTDLQNGSLTACVAQKGINCLTGGSSVNAVRQLTGRLSAAGAALNMGTLVGESRALFAAVQIEEQRTKARSISTPSLLATDSIPASINVGLSVPSATSQAVSNVTEAGTNAFAQTIQNIDTGVQLQVVARITPAGIVTMLINQQVSAPQGGAGPLNPAFQKRTVQTQVTVQDGDTIALGGVIQESVTGGQSGIPFLDRIPVLGAAFGAQNRNHQRTELIVFLTPHVIYDMNQAAEATEDLRDHMRDLQKLMRQDKDE
jgi:general secretion pathway protein D